MVIVMPPSQPDPARRNERSHRAILDAAIAVIGELGYERASVEAIARRAGVGKQTIYRWWPSKGAVILEALVDRRDAAIADLPLPETGGLVQDLRSALHSATQLLASPDLRAAYQAVIAAMQSDPKLVRMHDELYAQPRVEGVQRIVAQAQERGELRADIDTQTLVDMLWGAMYYRLLLHTRPLEPRQVDAALDIVLNGLR
jgi:AcrR family transcriptional regulator